MSTHYVDYIEPAEQIDLEEEPITNRQTNYKNTSNPRQSAASEKANDEKPSVGSALPTAQTPPVADKKPLPITPTNMQQYVDVQTSPKDDTPQDAVISTSKVLTSSNYNLDGDNLTINIALPARLLDGSKNINRAQNVTINLTFPHLNKPVNQVSQ